jgi:hypothetical protein
LTYHGDSGGGEAATTTAVWASTTAPIVQHPVYISYTQEDTSNKIKEEAKGMRHLYRITVVDPKTEDIEFEGRVIAETEGQALMKAKLSDAVRSKPENYDILVECVGSIRAKKDIQKVKIVKD